MSTPEDAAKGQQQASRTAAEAGWHVSRYNLSASLPNSDNVVIANRVWLPTCVGGCPHKRLYAERACTPLKDNPEGYVLALHARIGEETQDNDN